MNYFSSKYITIRKTPHLRDLVPVVTGEERDVNRIWKGFLLGFNDICNIVFL